MDDPSTPHPKKSRDRRTRRRAHTRRQRPLIKLAAPLQRPSPCAHTATRGTSARSTFRLSFVPHRQRSRRTSAGRTSRKSGRSHGRASGPRPMPGAPCFERNSPAWVAFRRQQRLRPTHAGTSPIRPCSARFRPSFSRPLWPLYLCRILRKPATRWLHWRLFFRPARQL